MVVQRGGSAEKAFSDALSGVSHARSVYVVGLNERDAFAMALDGKDYLTIEDASAEDMLRFAFVEAIGTEDSMNPVEKLITFANGRAASLQHESDRYLTKARTLPGR